MNIMAKAVIEGGSSSAYAIERREIIGTTALMGVNTEHVENNAALVTLTLPVTAAVGETIKITGQGATGWTIAQNAGQSIHVGNVNTTVGVGGSLSSTLPHDCVTLVCTVVDTEFVASEIVGALVVV